MPSGCAWGAHRCTLVLRSLRPRPSEGRKAVRSSVCVWPSGKGGGTCRPGVRPVVLPRHHSEASLPDSMWVWLVHVVAASSGSETSHSPIPSSCGLFVACASCFFLCYQYGFLNTSPCEPFDSWPPRGMRRCLSTAPTTRTASMRALCVASRPHPRRRLRTSS